MKLTRWVFGVMAVLALGVIVAQSSLADVLITKSGKRWEGTVTEQGDSYLVETEGAKFTFPKGRVRQVIKTDDSQPPKRSTSPLKGTSWAGSVLPIARADDALKATDKRVAYPRADLARLRHIEWLVAGGVVSSGDSKKVENLRVSDSVVVTGVPVGYLMGLGNHLGVRVWGIRGPDRGSSRLSIGKVLAVRWVGGRKYNIEVQFRLRNLTREEIIQGDAVLQRHVTLIDVLEPVRMGTAWILSTKEGFPPTGVSLWSILQWFEPDNLAKCDPKAIAEERVWTKALRLSDGTLQSVPECRLLIQASVLETVGFKVGDVTDKDKAVREKALARLKKAKADFVEARSQALKNAAAVRATLTAKGKDTPTEEEESKATSRLKMARVLIAAGKSEAARKSLAAIIAKHPRTQAAENAQKLLQQLGMKQSTTRPGKK